MHDCRIEIAGVPVRICCRYRENQEFFHGYVTEKEESFVITPTEADLERMQETLDRMDQAEGIPRHRRTEVYLENCAIHSLLAEGLVEHDILLMHGSALCMDGEGYLFTAKSGTGKSTHARLWREVFGDRVWMVNDDKPMLKIGKKGISVWGTPWDGKHHLSTNASAPLKAIIRLERGTENYIEPMKKADAFLVLARQCLASRNPTRMARIMELERQLLESVDFYTLSCTMDPAAAKAAWEGMQKQKDCKA